MYDFFVKSINLVSNKNTKLDNLKHFNTISAILIYAKCLRIYKFS